MSRIIAIIIAAALLAGSVTACSSPAGTTPPVTNTVTQSENKLDSAGVAKLENGKTIGTLFRPRPETDYKKWEEEAYKSIVPDFSIKGFVYYDSLTDGLLMLRSGKVDILQLMAFTGRYLVQRNQDLVLYTGDVWFSTTHMIFSPDRQSQYEKVNAAIKGMRNDGVLVKLTDQWITNLPVGSEPAGGKLPVINGAESLKVGISGDEPPLDYIAADGNPGGFNVAVLAEISKRANLNIELVTVNGGARFTALQSGKIDAFLWHNATQSVSGRKFTPSNILQVGSYNALLTENYLEAGSGVIAKK